MSRLGRFLRLAAVAVILAVLAGPSLSAQAPPEMTPPKVLVAYIGDVAPGKGAAAGKAGVAIRDLFAGAKWPTHWIALDSVTGPERVSVWVGYNSFADWGNEEKSLEREPKLAAGLARVSSEWSAQMKATETVVLKHEPELSYQPNVPLEGIRLFTVDVVHVRLGKGHEFVEAEKMSVAAHAKAKVDEHWAAYQVVAGVPEGLYVFFSPQTSLAEWDRAEQNHGKAYRDAFGGEENWKKFLGMLDASVKSVTMDLTAIDPAASHAPEDWVKADPEFWAPKHAGAPAAGKGARKPAKPAAKK
jgi:hypothetical protein